MSLNMMHSGDRVRFMGSASGGSYSAVSASRYNWY